MSKEIFLILHNIRSAHNVGSIFRTSDAVGVTEILLSGYTPCPLDRFGRKRGDIAKSALGAEESVPWGHITSLPKTIDVLRKRGFCIVAVEQHPRACDYKKLHFSYPVVFMFGNEVRGLSQRILTYCDTIAEIPMRGTKESLNVSVAAGVFLFKVLDI